MKKAPVSKQDEMTRPDAHTDRKASSDNDTNAATEVLQWRDAREAMYNDPCLRLQIPGNLPGPGEIFQGKSTPCCSEVSVVDNLPNIALKHGNLHWLALIIEVYIRFLERKAPPMHVHTDTINELRKMLSDLQPFRACDDERDAAEIIDIPLSLSEAFALREAVLCSRWIVRDWLPDCEERRNLLAPLNYLRQELNRVISEIL